MKRIVQYGIPSLFLLVVGVAFSADSLVLVSSSEQSPEANVCSLYLIQEGSRILDLQRQITATGGITRVEGYPKERKLLVWMQETSKNAQVSIVDLDDLESSRTITLPHTGIRGGYWMNDPVYGSSLMAVPFITDSKDPALYGIADRTKTPRQMDDLPWDRLLLHGSSHIRNGAACYQEVSLESEKGDLFLEDTKRVRRSLPFRLDAESLALLKTSQIRGLFLACNDGQQAVISTMVPLQKGNLLTFFVYDKKDKKWWRIAARGDGSTIQMFDDWFVVQEHVVREMPRAVPPTGGFGFHQRDGKGHFYWKATRDTEVLAIEGPRLFYRQGCQLMTADIEKNRIANERVLFKSEDAKTQKILEQVHWLFPMNTPKQP